MIGCPASMLDFPSAPGLMLDKHIQFLRNLENPEDSFEYWAMAHLRMSGIYWALTALRLLGRSLEEGPLTREQIIAFVKSCQLPAGGFGGNIGHDAHLLFTLSAVQILVIADALHEIDIAPIVAYISGLQKDDGSFAGDEFGEIDTRFSYCAVACLSLLSRLDAIDCEKTAAYIMRCQNFDHAFGTVPGAESHAGQVFCCVATLQILGKLHCIDGDQLGRWLSLRQLKNGGLNGRPEKLEDDSVSGGFSDRPGDVADVFHTLFAVAGLALLGYPSLEPVDPKYCLPTLVVERVFTKPAAAF